MPHSSFVFPRRVWAESHPSDPALIDEHPDRPRPVADDTRGFADTTPPLRPHRAEDSRAQVAEIIRRASWSDTGETPFTEQQLSKEVGRELPIQASGKATESSVTSLRKGNP